jgi:hypothetical protein
MEVGTEQYFHFIFNEQERRGEEDDQNRKKERLDYPQVHGGRVAVICPSHFFHTCS